MHFKLAQFSEAHVSKWKKKNKQKNPSNNNTHAQMNWANNNIATNFVLKLNANARSMSYVFPKPMCASHIRLLPVHFILFLENESTL